MVAGPFDQDHWYLQFSGFLPGAEQWTCGLRLARTTGLPVAVSPGHLAAASTACKDYFQAVGLQLSGRAGMNSVKLNAIGLDGLYSEPTTNEDVFAAVGGAGSAASTPPNQIALVISLTTPVTRGPAHRGRFYLPIPVLPLTADGRWNASDCVSASVATDSFVAALNAVDPNMKVAIFSRKVGAPAHRLVTGNLVGRVPDTQRRRRRSLVENYQ